MPRSLPEWKGATPDTPVPPRVRLRVLEKFNHRCDAKDGGCGRLIRPGDKWTCDHKKALILKGENRERNLRPLCEWCVGKKDASDQAEKSASYRIRAKHAGIKMKPKGRPLVGTIASGIKLSFGKPPVRRSDGQPLWRQRRC